MSLNIYYHGIGIFSSGKNTKAIRGKNLTNKPFGGILYSKEQMFGKGKYGRSKGKGV